MSAMTSSAMKPTLWRRSAYCGPGLPRPTQSCIEPSMVRRPGLDPGPLADQRNIATGPGSSPGLPCADLTRTACFFFGLVDIARAKHPIPSRTRPLSAAAPMVLRPKTRESRSLPSLIEAFFYLYIPFHGIILSIFYNFNAFPKGRDRSVSQSSQ